MMNMEGTVSSLEQRFEMAAQEAVHLREEVDAENVLQLYALYKQATVGDVSGNRPAFTDFVNRVKYDAWARVNGMSREEAMGAYIELVAQLKA